MSRSLSLHLVATSSLLFASLLSLPADAAPAGRSRAVRSSRGQARVAAFNRAIRQRFSVDSRKAPRSIGVFQALDLMRTQDATNFEQAVGLLGKYATGALVARGLSAQVAQKRVSKMQADARAGRFEGLVYRALVFTPDAMKKVLGSAHDPNMPFAQAVPETTQKYQLAKRVDLAKTPRLLTKLPLPQTKVEKQLGPLARVSIRNPHITDRAIRQNTLAAEVLERLAANQHVEKSADKFVVTFNGQKYSHLGDFLGALRATGHKIRVRFDHQNADFLKLKLVNGDAAQAVQSGQFQHIAAAMHTTIPTASKDGGPAIRPVAHSEIVVNIDASKVRRGDKFVGEVAGYQGVTHTGFFAQSLGQSADWVGNTTAGTMRDSKKALNTVLRFGLYTAAVNHVTKLEGKRVSAYGGAPGVCNDSVAVAQLVSGRPVTGYPMMGSETPTYLDNALETLSQNKKIRPADRRHYRSLLSAVRLLGRDDAKDSPTARPSKLYHSPLERAFESLPKQRALGSEQHADKLLRQALQLNP